MMIFINNDNNNSSLLVTNDPKHSIQSTLSKVFNVRQCC